VGYTAINGQFLRYTQKVVQYVLKCFRVLKLDWLPYPQPFPSLRERLTRDDSLQLQPLPLIPWSPRPVSSEQMHTPHAAD
jgi:hypothetical protein